MDGAPVRLLMGEVRDEWARAVLARGGEQAKARARCWLGDGGGGEADFSAAPITKNVIGFGRNDVF